MANSVATVIVAVTAKCWLSPGNSVLLDVYGLAALVDAGLLFAGTSG